MQAAKKTKTTYETKLLIGNDNPVNIIIESKDTSCQQEGLSDIEEKPRSYVFDFKDLICDKYNAAYDEQYGAQVLDFLFCFHGL